MFASCLGKAGDHRTHYRGSQNQHEDDGADHNNDVAVLKQGTKRLAVPKVGCVSIPFSLCPETPALSPW